MERSSSAKLAFVLFLFLAASLIACSSGEEQDLKELAILGRKVNGVCACGPFAGKCGDGCGDQCIPVTLWVGICV
ncbi:hypothetical protein MTR67_020032 [Solanum verrucosum]|uniref:Uncharacterized protein n=1 Tax=Solanum verrucosum TaxID=315347 RepID=A0AAF0TN90_SOLVR|nr:hypothetical protein MTR67_020032 [Solanum verrucosum]